ncbi:MAG: SCO family protein [Anaerolineae bacterium]|nr:SCO family protein [Anaerolineae bacterium]
MKITGAVLVGVVLIILAMVIARPIRVLPYQAPAPIYTLIDQHGEPFNSGDLQSSVVLYSFIYTHCTTVCPAITAQMKQVALRLEEDGLLGNPVKLVTVTFDPARDTPQRLTEYAAQFDAPPDDWVWLTGNPTEIKKLVGGEFGVYFEQVAAENPTSDPAPAEEAYDFVHATVYVLVDDEGVIRSEYLGMMDIDRTVRDIRRVVNEERSPAALSPLYRAAHLLRWYP